MVLFSIWFLLPVSNLLQMHFSIQPLCCNRLCDIFPFKSQNSTLWIAQKHIISTLDTCKHQHVCVSNMLLRWWKFLNWNSLMMPLNAEHGLIRPNKDSGKKNESTIVMLTPWCISFECTCVCVFVFVSDVNSTRRWMCDK